MRLIQKILSHGLLIALIVAAIYVYIRRDELSLPWIGTKGQAVQQQAVIDKPGKETTTVTASNPEDASPETRQVSKEENSRPDEVNGATGQDVQEPAADNTTDPIASTDMPEEVKPAESAVVEHPEDVKPAEPAAVEHTEEQISSSRTEPTVNTEAESAAVVTEDKPVVTAMASPAATPETEVPAVPDTPAREQSTPRHQLPRLTPVLKSSCRKQGCITVTGISVLLSQRTGCSVRPIRKILMCGVKWVIFTLILGSASRQAPPITEV